MNRTVGVVACPACTHVVNRDGVEDGDAAQGTCRYCENSGVFDDATCTQRRQNCGYCDERGSVTIDRAVAFYFRK